MPSFPERVRTHLATYKRSVLGVAEDGVWLRNGRPYAHILPAALKHLNVLEPVRDALWEHAHRAGIRLHSDFHHLNSSQALAFNLFFPVLAAGAAAHSLVKALTGQDGRVVSWAFEAVPDRVEGTNFDVALALYGGGTVYVEVKYTESGFGTAVPDEAHLRKLAEVYRPRLIGKVDPSFLEPANFFPNYQLLRNVSHLGSEADRVVFVVPSGNLTAIEHARTLLDNALAPGVTGVSLVTLEAVFTALRAAATGLLIRHYQEFEEKYLPELSAP